MKQLKSVCGAICVLAILAGPAIARADDEKKEEKKPCCAATVEAGKKCDHECCQKAAADGKVCEKCHPKDEKKDDKKPEA